MVYTYIEELFCLIVLVFTATCKKKLQGFIDEYKQLLY